MTSLLKVLSSDNEVTTVSSSEANNNNIQKNNKDENNIINNGEEEEENDNSDNDDILFDDTLLVLPRHSNEKVNKLLSSTEESLIKLHHESCKNNDDNFMTEKSSSSPDDIVFSNSYVDLGKVDIVGFDYDYTLLTYKEELLELIYEMALRRLVMDRKYPLEMLSGKMKFDPQFSIRGLAVDKETGWVCHLSYTHKVAVAWEGREKVSTERMIEEYSGKRALSPSERRERIKPLNDLFSMAECCLIADTVQFFKDNEIPFCARNAVMDILEVIRDTHISGDFHRVVSKNLPKYVEPAPHLKEVLQNLKTANKSLIFVSNSPFWFVDAGMKYVIGDNWKDDWDAIITSAGKPRFYTETNRPFRQVCLKDSERITYDRVTKLEKDKVYTEGCIKELARLMKWNDNNNQTNQDDDTQEQKQGFNNNNFNELFLSGSNVLYVGDSLFADLVDAKREFGWTTAGVTPEVGYEMELQRQSYFVSSQQSITLLLNALRHLQHILGPTYPHSKEDCYVMDQLEQLVSKWRDRETNLMGGNAFGSVFRARHQPSLFAHSVRKYCDLYMSSVSSLRHYSPQHRFYPPENSRLLTHERTTNNNII